MDMDHQRTSAEDMEWTGSLSGRPLTNGGRVEGRQRTSAEDMCEPDCQRTTAEGGWGDMAHQRTSAEDTKWR